MTTGQCLLLLLAWLTMTTVANVQTVSLSSNSSPGPSPITISQQCPTQEDLISPCTCNASKKEVLCRGSFPNSDVKLRDAFLMFAKLVPVKLQYFSSIYINLRELTLLDRAVFAGIRFGNIVLKGANLTKIDREAFVGTEHDVLNMYIYGTNLTNTIDDQYNFFSAIQSLNRIQKLVLTKNRLTSIPDR